MPLMLVDLLSEPPQPDNGKRRRLPPLQCLCGRFARWGGGRHYYNGYWNCYSYTVLCSRCGEVTVECV